MTDHPDQDEDVRGYIYTHFDCPYCDFDDYREGDISGEEVNCNDCHKTFVIGRVQ